MAQTQIKIEQLAGLPEVARAGRGTPGPFMEAMKSLKLPVGNKFSAFFVPGEAPDGLTDPDEQRKAIREHIKKLSNRFGGIAKRITKGDAAFKFAFRTEHQNRDDADSPLGVRVYRVKVE